MKSMWLALALACLAGGAAQAQAQTQVQTHRATTPNPPSGCAMLANKSYAIQMTGQLNDSPGMHLVTGVWTFGADASGTGQDYYIMPPASGAQYRNYDIQCSGGSQGSLRLTISHATSGTFNANGDWYAFTAEDGARIAVSNGGAGGFRMGGWAVQQ
jgi:hypothetical protein